MGTQSTPAERVRKIGGTTIRSIGHIARLQRVRDNDDDCVTPVNMLRELYKDEKAIALSLRAACARRRRGRCGNRQPA
jgi:starvation-inducible DNA-binding protein